MLCPENRVKRTNSIHLKKHKPTWPRLRTASLLLAAPCCAFMSASSIAQAGSAESPSQLDVPDAYRQLEADQTKLSLDPASPSYLSPNSFLVWGPIVARPHLDTRFTYGDNLRTSNGSNANTFLAEISPGSLFELGKKWRLDYTPTFSYYASDEFKDTLAHHVQLSGGTTYNNWAFTLSQTYSDTSQPLIETGRQTDEQIFATSLGASYYFASKLMLELGVSQNIRNTESFTRSRTWSTMDWLNYQLSSRLSAGVGIGGGYENVSPGSDMTFEQVQAKLNFHIAQKIDFAVRGGGEIRQILDADGDPLVNPIYGASLIYHVFQFTTLSLSADRTVSAALQQDQIDETTSVSLAVNQRLFGLFYLTLSGGFSNTQYITANAAQDLHRDDDTANFAATLAYSFTPRATASIFYNYNDNSSSLSGFSYSTSQVGLQLGYRF
jgi:hypothetical protein